MASHDTTSEHRVSNTGSKRVVLAFVGQYLPAHNGIARSMVNMVDHLCGDFDFRIVTRVDDDDRARTRADVRPGEWQQVGNASVYYVQHGSFSLRHLAALISNTPHDVIYLSSFFDPFTVHVLLLRLLGRVTCPHVVVAPRGEFGWGSLRLKYPKKRAFMTAARLAGLYRNVVWHASTDEEALEIMTRMRVPRDRIQIALDLPTKLGGVSPSAGPSWEVSATGLRVVFLSRIAREKNLDYALNVLRKTKARVVFDIFGPMSEPKYWEECSEILKRMPPNVTATYRGPISPDNVSEVFGRYDLFLFPTSGENYGHVIAESLTAGTPVLISRETPWRDLEAVGLGWDLDLRNPDAFVRTIDALASVPRTELESRRTSIQRTTFERLAGSGALESNRKLLGGQAA